MALQRIFCPNCGKETQIDNEKAFCFCLQCGNKIDILKQDNSNDNNLSTTNKDSGSVSDSIQGELEKKLEEVAFYYELSQEKMEHAKYNENPTYYIKAQDILVDLSEQYPNDWRIWWELCKPVDFKCPLSGNSVYDSYAINDNYFNKALDYANIEKKKELIAACDIYQSKKEEIKKQTDSELKDQENKNEQVNTEKQQKCMLTNEQLWKSLEKKEYKQIDNSYFEIPYDNNQRVIGVLKVMANVMYVIAFRIDETKSNIVYREQSISIKFDNSGRGIKFDNRPVRIKGFAFPNNELKIECNEEGTLCINNTDLISDVEYVGKIMSQAKKPLLSFDKIFD